MTHFDQFFDTKKKRQYACCIVCLLLFSWGAFTNVATALKLISLDSYEAMFAALTEQTLDTCYISRFILMSMSIVDSHLIKIGTNLFLAMRLIDIIFVLITCILCIAETFRDVRKKFLWIPILYILQFFIVCSIALYATKGDSFMVVITYIRIIGYSILCVQSIVFIIIFIHMYHCLGTYRSALQYYAVEVNED